MRKVKSRIKPLKTARASKITFALNANLVQQAENWLNSQWVQHDYTYSSLSELIRKSLQAYQDGEIDINFTERDKHAPKREITVRFGLAPDLLNFYYSLPYTQRTAIIEESLREYLDKLNARELEEYVKVISTKPQPQLIPYRYFHFVCARCGEEYEDAVVSSVAKNWEELKTWKYDTYCGGCVRHG